MAAARDSFLNNLIPPLEDEYEEPIYDVVTFNKLKQEKLSIPKDSLEKICATAKKIDELEPVLMVEKTKYEKETDEKLKTDKKNVLANHYYELAQLYHQLHKDCHAAGATTFNLGPTKCSEYLQAALALGHAETQHIFGMLYSYGFHAMLTIKPAGFQGTDNTKAVEYFKLAVLQGYTQAEFQLGMHYSGGLGTDQNEKLGFQYYEKAAKKGYGAAEYEVCQCYWEGRGVNRHPLKSLEYAKSYSTNQQMKALK